MGFEFLSSHSAAKIGRVYFLVMTAPRNQVAVLDGEIGMSGCLGAKEIAVDGKTSEPDLALVGAASHYCAV